MNLKELGVEFQRTRNPAIFDQIYKRITPGLKHYITNIVKDDTIADDITSSVMESVYTKIDMYNPQWQLSTWIYKIGFNSSCMYLRTVKKSPVLSDPELYDQLMLNPSISNDQSQFIYGEDWDSSDLYSNKLQLMSKCVDELPDKCREIMKLFFYEGLPLAEISSYMNLPLHTIKNRIHNAKALIRKKFEQNNKILHEDY